MSTGTSRLLAFAAIACVVYGVTVFIAMHFLQPELNPLRAPGSAYVLGAYGSLMTTGYFVLCIGWFALVFGIISRLPSNRITQVALAIALIAGAGTILAGIFPMDFPPPMRTRSGRLHALGGAMTFPSLVLASNLLSLSFRRSDKWRGVAGSSSALAAGMIFAVLLTFFSVLTLGFGGYAQRLFMTLFYAWMVVVALHLSRMDRSSALVR